MIDWTDGGRGTLTAQGKKLEYATWGNRGAGPMIILLHEGLGCVDLWRSFPADLAAKTGLPVFSYSRAGYGKSDPANLPHPVDYMTREAVDVLPTVLHETGAAQYILLGHSDGATIAAIYAGSIQDHALRGLILMAPHFFTEEMGLQEIAKAKHVFETTDLPQKMAKYHNDPDHTFTGWNNAWLNPAFKSWNVADVIDYWRVPVLAIQGREDQYGTLAQIAEIEAHTYCPVDTVILDDCRHVPHLEQSDQTLNAIATYCAHLTRIESEASPIPA